MEKLLIVDDEEWIVEGLKLQLPWEKYGIVLTEPARNGKEALKIIERERPSIVMSDIRMPQMDGLELAEYVCRNHKECEFIIISGYTDFEYAKKAMSYGVIGYVTKPVEREELEVVIKEALKKLEKKSMESRTINELQMIKENRQFTEKYLKAYIASEEELEQKKYIMTVFHMTSLKIAKEGEDPASYFLELLRKHMSRQEHTIVFQNMLEKKQYIMITENDACADYEKELQLLKNNIKITLNKIKTKMDLEGVVGISSFYENTNQSFKNYLQTKFIVENIHSDRSCNIMALSEFEKMHSEVEIEYEVIRKLINEVEKCNKSDALKLCKNLAEKWLNGQYPIMFVRVNVQEILINLSQILTKKGDSMYNLNYEYANAIGQIWKIESSENLMELLFKLIEAAIEHIHMRRDHGEETLTEEVKKYIEVHYAEPLTLADVAKMFYVNPTYLSRVFKREIGIGFNDYLRKRRLEVSAELIKTTNLKIYEVANLVGFDNPNYFMKKFLEHYGVTPSKYREEKIKI